MNNKKNLDNTIKFMGMYLSEHTAVMKADRKNY